MLTYSEENTDAPHGRKLNCKLMKAVRFRFCFFQQLRINVPWHPIIVLRAKNHDSYRIGVPRVLILGSLCMHWGPRFLIQLSWLRFSNAQLRRTRSGRFSRFCFVSGAHQQGFCEICREAAPSYTGNLTGRNGPRSYRATFVMIL